MCAISYAHYEELPRYRTHRFPSRIHRHDAYDPRSRQYPAPDDVAAPPADAEVTESGLAFKILQEGTGEEHPAGSDIVKVHYTGWTTDGKMFDSSVSRGEPVRLPLDRVIVGWTEGLQLMVVGEKRRFWIPEALAYRVERARPGHAGLRRRTSRLAKETRTARSAGGRRRSTPGCGGHQIGSRQQGAAGWDRHRSSEEKQRGHRSLQRLDHRWPDVRQLGHARPTSGLSPRSSHCRLDRGSAADGLG